MKRLGLIAVLGAGLVSFQVSAADALSECYRQADTTIEVSNCLKKEMTAVQNYYDDVLDRVMNSARELDRVQRKREAVPALTRANRSFDEYVKDQCGYVEASYGSGNGAGAAALACRINLYRARAGEMDAQFVTKN